MSYFCYFEQKVRKLLFYKVFAVYLTSKTIKGYKNFSRDLCYKSFDWSWLWLNGCKHFSPFPLLQLRIQPISLPQVERESVSKMNSWKLVTRPLFNFISFLISFGCISYVSYESYNCVLKFLSSPQGTRLSIHFIGDTLVFPDITICAHPGAFNQYGFRYNESFLKDCGIIR